MSEPTPAPAAPSAPTPPAAPPSAPAAPATPSAAPSPTPAAPVPSEPAAPTAQPTQAATPEAPPAEPTPEPSAPSDPRYDRYANLYRTGQWADDKPPAAAQPQSFDDLRQMLDQRLPQPQEPVKPDPYERLTSLLANGDVRGFMEAQAEFLSEKLKPAAPSEPPIDQQQLMGNVAQVVRMERQLAQIEQEARTKHAHLAPLESMISQRAQELWAQAQDHGRIQTDADVPVAYRAALDTAISEAQELYTRIRGTGQSQPNVVRTDVVAASPGSNVAERDAAPIGQQPTSADVETSSWLEQRRKLQFAKKRNPVSLNRPAA